MERNRISVRERVCVACENPSPGPIKLLYYRWRHHGPFFPLLERLKTDENARYFVNGRVPVCNSCASYLQRQWNNYEKKSINLPIEKRTYRLLSDERWQKLNRKNYDETEKDAEQHGREILSYDDDDYDDENTIQEEIPSKLPHVRQSKIPKLATQTPYTKPKFENETEMLSSQDMDTRVSEYQNSKLLRKMAEMKFNEEHEYIQRKVQKTMKMVHFKGRDERIREIEEELKESMGDELDGERKQQRKEDKTAIIIPFENTHQEGTKGGIDRLKKHMDREMAIQHQEIENFRKNIKTEISQAMEKNYYRYEELWNFIARMNDEQKRGSHRRARPYTDDIFFSRTPKIKRRIPKHMKFPNQFGESDDVGFSDYH